MRGFFFSWSGSLQKIDSLVVLFWYDSHDKENVLLCDATAIYVSQMKLAPGEIYMW